MNSPHKLDSAGKGQGRLAGALLAFALAGASIASASCQPNVRFTEGRTYAGGREVTAKELTDGHDAYMLYCYACHGEKGDGHGPSSYGLRPQPRDFTKGIFKFARMRSSDDVPNDEDLVRIVQGGLHGTAMLPWDIPDVELDLILQYVKTFNQAASAADESHHLADRWAETTKSGKPRKVLEEFDASQSPDPWTDEQAAIESGRDLYHFRAQCATCHPSYGTKQELFNWSVAASKKEPAKFKPVGGFRDDMYGSVAKDSPDYATEIMGADGKMKVTPARLMPPDFTFSPLRSIREGSELVDIFRLVSYGVYPIMPSWKGAGLDDKDIWAIAHYIRSLERMKEEASPELAAMRKRFAEQPPFQIPPQKPDAPPAAAGDAAAPPAPAGDAAAADKKDAGDKKEAPAKR